MVFLLNMDFVFGSGVCFGYFVQSCGDGMGGGFGGCCFYVFIEYFFGEIVREILSWCDGSER